jgi:DNA-binding NtrC family response regulator
LLLAELFLKDIARAAGRTDLMLHESARQALLRHHWPGNVRELRNAMEHAFIVADSNVVTDRHLPTVSVVARSAELGSGCSSDGTLPARLDEIERQELAAAMTAEGGNQTRAARRLGISRRALIHKLDKFSLSRRFGAEGT